MSNSFLARNAVAVTAVLLASTAMSIGGAQAAAGKAATVRPYVGTSSAGGPITRSEILARAQSWIDEKVPYSETSFFTDTNGTYRQDCSGYISMAWHLVDGAPNWGETTWALPNFATELGSYDDLQPGDMLDRDPSVVPQLDQHVVLFVGWTDNTHTNAVVDEEPHTPLDAQQTTMSVSDLNSGNYLPFTYKNIYAPPPSSSSLDQLHQDGSIWQYTGTPGTGWTKIGSNPAAVAVASSSGNFYELDNTGTIWSYQGTPISGWTKIGNNSAAKAIAAGPSSFYELDSTGTIWSYNGTPITGWTKVGDNSAAKAIAVSGSTLYELDSTGTIWSYVSGTWTELDTNSATVAVSAGGNGVYQLHSDGSIWSYTGVPLSGWTKIGDNSAAVNIRADAAGGVYELDSTGTIWSYAGGTWTKLADNAAAINTAVGYDGTLYELDNTGTIWTYNGTPITGWSTLDTNPRTIAISAGPTNTAHL